MKVLIAEDEEALASIMREELERARFTVTIARDGVEAMKAVKKSPPDIILLDLLMPKKDGFEVLEELKADPVLKTIPVIILSNLVQDADVKRGMELGAVDYLLKVQLPLKEVVEKVRSYLAKPKQLP